MTKKERLKISKDQCASELRAIKRCEQIRREAVTSTWQEAIDLAINTLNRGYGMITLITYMKDKL